MKSKTATVARFRRMTYSDMKHVLDIERQCFEFSWSGTDFMRCLDQANCAGMVFNYHGRVLGYAVFEVTRQQLCILNLAVHPACRRRGFGKRIIVKLIGSLSKWKCSGIVLQIRETNLAAQLFFRAMGFRAVSILKDFYDDSDEDAYLMQYCIRPHSAASGQNLRTVAEHPTHRKEKSIR